MSDPNNNNNVFPPREYDRQDSLSTIETIQTIDTKTTGGENNRVIVTLGSNDESDSNNNNNNNMTRTTILDGMARAQSHTVMLGALAANNNNNQQQQQQQLYSPSNETDPLASPTPKQGNHLSASPYAIMYGATTTDHHHSPQEHEFHYGSTDHQDSSSFVFPDPYAPRQSSCCSKWCCLFSPLTNCVREICTSPALHRSFCYGGIDGMLTGAGIVAAFAGLGMLLPPEDSSTTHDAHMAALDDDNGSNRYWYIVAFSAAACVADALCMALGHVWTTRNLIVHQVHERSVAKRAFLEEPTQRHLAKGELVERLVQQKGMLKIDAMSLADTLEGYPDLFVSALISDSLDGAATASHDEQQAYGTQYSNSNNNHPQGGPLRTIPSYGKVPHHDEFDMDPDARMIRTAIRESMAESCFMFAGFSLFAVVPSLICCILPMMNTLEDNNEDESANHAPLVKPQTLFLLLVCIIMSVLGAWKSRFIEGDTNALVFALEAVAVLIIGLCAGYAVGSFIVYMTGLELILVATKVSQEL